MRTDELSIPDPCSVPWDAMDGTGCRRFCRQCQKTVTDISQMTEREARGFLDANPTACIQMDVWNDTVLFRPEPRGRSLRPSGRLRRLATAAGLLGLGTPAFASGSAETGSLVEWVASWFAPAETPTTTDPIPEVEAEPVQPFVPPKDTPITRLGGAPMRVVDDRPPPVQVKPVRKKRTP